MRFIPSLSKSHKDISEGITLISEGLKLYSPDLNEEGLLQENVSGVFRGLSSKNE